MSPPCSSLLIDPTRLWLLLGEQGGRFHVDSLAECESTSTLLYERAEQGSPSGSVIVADRQTAGRGSRGRRWSASPESGLTFSILWRFGGAMDRLSGLSLAVGVAVVRALESFGAVNASLKWPNDILHENAKLGGILVELIGEEDHSLAVIGIGLNLSLPEHVEETPFALAPAALDAMLETLPERHELLAKLLIELAQAFDRFAHGGFAELRDDWHARHAWQDKPVRLVRDGRIEKEGVCLGADTDGAFLVWTAEGVERCLSGDLSLRPV